MTMGLKFLVTETDERIPTLHLKHFRSQGVTLLFSHGNAVDLGLLRDHFLCLCCELHVRASCMLTTSRRPVLFPPPLMLVDSRSSHSSLNAERFAASGVICGLTNIVPREAHPSPDGDGC